MRRPRLASLFLAVVAVPLWAQAPSALGRFPKTGPLVLHEEQLALPPTTILVGEFDVAEDPVKPAGRHITLHVVVLPAKAEHPLPDPIVFLAGGPGQAATTLAPQLANYWMRQQRDIVLVDQRGTGQSNPLQVTLPGSAEDLQGYLDLPWRESLFKQSLAELQKVADLTKYTTAIAMDDVDAVRRALGYDKVDLVGGSYGTRAALVYMKRHKEHVRCAVLDGVAPIAFKNPLYHAQAGQDAFEALRQEVLADPEYRAAFGDLADDLSKVMAQLQQKPAAIDVELGRKTATVQLTKDGFAESLRHMLYSEPSNRMVPSLLHSAARGNLEPFATSALQYNRAVHDMLAYGLLMSVTNGEDLPRIREEEIGPATKNSFLGDARVRGQLAIGAFWPRAVVPDADEAVSVDVPVLLLSGTHDPVTPPRWGAEAASHLPHSLHVVVPGCHGVSTKPGVDKLVQQFVERASVEGLDLKVVERVKLAKIRLPKQE
jgi:pimeloyl-ACP methyl ester carboxylesterase